MTAHDRANLAQIALLRRSLTYCHTPGCATPLPDTAEDCPECHKPAPLRLVKLPARPEPVLRFLARNGWGEIVVRRGGVRVEQKLFKDVTA